LLGQCSFPYVPTVDQRDKAIGVFDSGVGGLTVHAALRRLLPKERLVYLGDTARVPYGSKSPAVITRYALNNARFLSQFDLKLLVVACNTVSATALPALTAALPLPVLGMVEPGVAAALQTGAKHVGVIGTPGTIRSGAYQAALRHSAPAVRVSTTACNLFVPLAEEGWTSGDLPRAVAHRYLDALRADGVDTLLLACTHYPLLRAPIAEAMGTGVRLVDSAETSAVAAARLLEAQDLLSQAAAGSERLFVTDLPEQFGAVAERFLGRPVGQPEVVDIAG
jgi:glutamate racemase